MVSESIPYREFIASKKKYAEPSGFHVDPSELSPALFDWQRDVVSYALRIGRGALFEECGLGKTVQQLEWCYQVAKKTRGLVLSLCPLAVAQQTIREAERFELTRGLPICFAASQDQIPFTNGIVITNYEKLKNFKADRFAGIDLDESSCLKSFTSQTKKVLCDLFRETPYRLAATATPSPNDLMELGNHSQFLGAMPSSEMLSVWFINDTMKVGKYRLRGHAEEDFWRWVASWGVCLSSPADLGYPADGYVLPPLEIIEHEVDCDEPPPEKGQLFSNESINATSIHREKRRSIEERAEVVGSLVNGTGAGCGSGDSTSPWIVWCDTDYEADALVKRIPDAVEVRGSYADSRKERLIEAFTTGEARVIITKPEICGFGLNWQHCSRTVFAGLSYSFERFYQATRRIYRFGQKSPVKVHIVNSPAEQVVWRTVRGKEDQHKLMQSRMSEAMQESQMEFVRGVRKLREYQAGRAMELPGWLAGRM